MNNIATEKKLFKCRECGHKQEKILQQENYTLHPDGHTDFWRTEYIFECGHSEWFSEHLLMTMSPSTLDHKKETKECN